MEKLAHTVWTLEDVEINGVARTGKRAQRVTSFNETDFILEGNDDEEGLIERFNMTK